MNKKAILIPLLFSLLLLFGYPVIQAEAAEALADGTYTVSYTVLKADNDSASMANDYFNKPATLIVQGGQIDVQIQLNHSAWIKSIEVNNIVPKVIHTDESADTRTIEFRATDLSTPIVSSIHVDIEEINYDHVYTIRFSFDGASITELSNTPAAGADQVNDTDWSPSSEQGQNSAPTTQAAESKGSNRHGSGVNKDNTTVESVVNPKTGDNTQVGLLVVLSIVSILFLLKTGTARKKAS